MYRFIKTKCEKLEYFSLIERPEKYMERHVTFLIFKNFATRREVFYLSVDDFQISKSTPDYNGEEMNLAQEYRKNHDFVPLNFSASVIPIDHRRYTSQL